MVEPVTSGTLGVRSDEIGEGARTSRLPLS